ncbi:MAG: polyprenyl synthetase family protein [Lachnospiraceae bacterium]|nr:polyprenyl synthetase family protein [Lachnospiraceae bacterium]
MEKKNTFLEFYAESRGRLEQKIREYNGKTAQEPHPLLKPFFEDFADLNEGGKLLRGVFVNLGYALARAEQEKGNSEEESPAEKSRASSVSDPLAMAFEIFQTAVLIHDDVIDHAELRRGKRTAHFRYADRLTERNITDRAGDTPASAAVCLGDAGLYAANLMIAENLSSDPALGKLIAYFDSVVIDTIRGELLDVILPCEIGDPSRSPAESDQLLMQSVREIYHLKTARYSVIGPLHLGMLQGGASPELMELVDCFADEAGTAFQIKDDIFGIYADEKKLGKDIGSDIAEAKLTILYEYVKLHDPAAHEELLKDYGHAPVTEEMLRRVQNIFRESGAYDYAREEMEKCFGRASEYLEKTALPESEKEMLRGLVNYLRGRDK